MCPHYLSLTNSSFYLEQWFSKCSPWTSSSSITWGLVRNADSGASPPDLLNQKLWALGPVTCVLTHLPHDSDTAKMWKPLVKRLEEAVWYKRKTCFELTQVGFVHIPRICLKHTYHWSHLRGQLRCRRKIMSQGLPTETGKIRLDTNLYLWSSAFTQLERRAHSPSIKKNYSEVSNYRSSICSLSQF